MQSELLDSAFFPQALDDCLRPGIVGEEALRVGEGEKVGRPFFSVLDESQNSIRDIDRLCLSQTVMKRHFGQFRTLEEWPSTVNC